MKIESEGDMSSGARSRLKRGLLDLDFFSDFSSEDSAELSASPSLEVSFLALDFFLDFFFSAPSPFSCPLESDSETSSALGYKVKEMWVRIRRIMRNELYTFCGLGIMGLASLTEILRSCKRFSLRVSKAFWASTAETRSTNANTLCPAGPLPRDRLWVLGMDTFSLGYC